MAWPLCDKTNNINASGYIRNPLGLCIIRGIRVLVYWILVKGVGVNGVSGPYICELDVSVPGISVH